MDSSPQAPMPQHHRHSSLPIIVGLLSLLLVLQTAGVGYIVTQMAMPEKAAIGTYQPNARLAKSDASELTNILSKVKRDTVKTYEDNTEKAVRENGTYLDGVVSNLNEGQSCTYINLDLSEIQAGKFDETARQLVGEKNLSSFILGMNYLDMGFLAGYCETDSMIYLKTASAQLSSGTVFGWQKNVERPYFDHVVSVGGVADGNYQFFPRAFEGHHLLRTGWGDAGHFWADTMLITGDSYNVITLESCKDSPNYPTDPTADIDLNNITRTKTCSLEYVP